MVNIKMIEKSECAINISASMATLSLFASQEYRLFSCDQYLNIYLTNLLGNHKMKTKKNRHEI